MEKSSFHDHQLRVSDWPEWQLFDTLNSLLADVSNKVQEANLKEIGALYPFLDSISESSVSLRLLVNKMALRDSYVIARVIYETSINACFLLTEPEVLSIRASTHAKQKALRSLVRSVKIAEDEIFDYKAPSTDKFLCHPTHQDWLKEFTSKSGREITSWTPENVQERLEAIYLKFGREPTIGMAFGLLLYRHASEIAHGTLYGTLFSWGAMDPNAPLKSPGDIDSFRHKELRHLLKLVCFTLESVVRVAGEAFAIPDVALSAREARSEYYRRRKPG